MLTIGLIYFLAIYLLLEVVEYKFGDGRIKSFTRTVLKKASSKLYVLRAKNIALFLEVMAAGIIGSAVYETIFKDSKDKIFIIPAICTRLLLIEISSLHTLLGIDHNLLHNDLILDYPYGKLS